jgi:hypothetical protein
MSFEYFGSAATLPVGESSTGLTLREQWVLRRLERAAYDCAVEE